MVNMSDIAPETDAGEEPQPAKRQKLDAPEADGDTSADLSNVVEELPKEISDALDELDCCQREIDNLNEKASEEILKVEQKFNGLRKPLYGKRTEIIGKIPQFWLTAFSNHPHVAVMIEEEEEKCLQYLRDLVVEENDDIKSGYKIKFIFDENPYFENLELVKDVHLPYGLTNSSAPEDKPFVASTEIKWKKGMDLLKVKEKRPKKSNRWQESTQSFLEWLTRSGDPTGDEIAEVLKDDLWPSPMQYYLAPDVDCEENGMDDDDDEEGLEEEDSGDEQDDAVVVVEEEEDEDEGHEMEGEDDLEEEEAGGDDQADPDGDEVEDDEEA